MRLRFSKMQGLGNDFVVIDAIAQPLALTRERVQKLADRHYGVGCDQVLVVETASLPETAFRYRIFNADGDEVEQCGNGARCFMRFLHEKGLSKQSELQVETAGGVIGLCLEEDGRVRVDMGVPRLAAAEVPFVTDSDALEQSVQLSNGESVLITALSMGNPHAVLLAEDVTIAAVARVGALLERHDRFPARVNVGFMQVIDRNHIGLRVFERGVGETMACGTGACAAAVAGVLRGLLATPVRVEMPGGALEVDWGGRAQHVFMTGEARTVFEGEIELV